MLIPKIGGRYNKILLLGVYVVLTVWAIAFLFPLFWIAVSSLKDEINVYKPTILIPPRAKIATTTIDYDSFPLLMQDELKKQVVEDVAVVILRTLTKFRNVYQVNVSATIDGKEILNGQVSRVAVQQSHPEYLYWSESKIRGAANEILAQYDVKYHWEGKNTKKEKLRYTPKTSLNDLSLKIQKELQSLNLPGKVDVKVSSSILKMFDTYRMAWTSLGELPFWRFFLNSSIYTGGVIVSQLTISALAAYALSRLFSQRVSKFLLIFYLATMMLPPMMLFLPLFLMIRSFPFPTVPFTSIPFPHINLVNTYWGLILPHTAWGFSIFLFEGFFNQLPEELFDAARIDGASEIKIFWKIVTPLSKPAYAIIALYTFIAVWMNFLWPFLVCTDRKMWTYTVALFYIQGAARIPQNVAMASSIISCIPTVIVFLLFQRFVQKGIAWTGLKG
jgi:multiple sugar transport system permease protein